MRVMRLLLCFGAFVNAFQSRSHSRRVLVPFIRRSHAQPVLAGIWTRSGVFKGWRHNYMANNIGTASRRAITSVSLSDAADGGSDSEHECAGVPHEMTIRSSEMICAGSAHLSRAGPRTGSIINAESYDSTRPAISPVYHIVLEHSGAFRFSEGQSVGIRPPGVHPRTGRPHPPRLYSIASCQRGDDGLGKSISLCVARVGWNRDATGASVPQNSVRPCGLCSEFLCTSPPGTTVLVGDPMGRNFIDPTLLRQPNSTISNHESNEIDAIFVATGTGIAPFRSMILGLFGTSPQDMSNTLAKYTATSRCLLYFGCANEESLLYKSELDEVRRQYPNNFEYHSALSREEGQPKTYVQDLLNRDMSIILERLRNGAHIYFSGYKDMINGVKQVIKQGLVRSGDDDSNYIEFMNTLKSENRWHSEIYG